MQRRPVRDGTMNLETARLRLRPLRDSDLDAYAELCADPEVMR
jgi:RimJ/RimL family protein N-acetyltransferase